MLKYFCAALLFMMGLFAISWSVSTRTDACNLAAVTGAFGQFGGCNTAHNCVAYRYPDTCTLGSDSQDCTTSGTESSYEYMPCGLDVDGNYTCREGYNGPYEGGSQAAKKTIQCNG